jgi:hypothetical protein
LKVAGREQVDAGHLELGRRDRPLVARDAHLREVVGGDLGLLEQGRDQAIALAAVLHAFAHRVDLRVVGLQRVVDDDAALAVQPGLLRQRDVRPYPDGHHDQVRVERGAVGEAHAGHARVAEDLGPLTLCVCHAEAHAALLERGLQHRRRGPVELALHQAVEQVDHGHLHALAHQAIGRLEAEQAAADDHRGLP